MVHDLLPLSFRPEYPRQQHYFHHLVPRALRLSRRVIADSESTRSDVIRRFEIVPEKVTVVFPGYNPELYAPGEKGTLRDLDLRGACLVLPSLADGFGLPVLEAMACGLPVITSRVSSLAQVAGNAVVTVKPYDSIELSDAMHRVLADRDSARTCDAAASSGPGSLPGGRRPSRYQ